MAVLYDKGRAVTIVAKVFMSGRSQALRLPARLRLTAKEVRIEQVGADWWLHPQTPPEHDMGLWLQGFYDHAAPLPDHFLADRRDPLPQERDWS
jgi:antitoxin VapB